MSKADLKVDWCSYEAAKYAVEHWHYSQAMPLGKLVSVGAWECGNFIGAVLFARGNSPTLGKRYGVAMVEVCELARVALGRHSVPVSRIVTLALKLLRVSNPGLCLVVSFADPAHGHHGGIYQAMGWIYDGESRPEFQFLHRGKWKHRREITSGAFGGAKRIADRGQSLCKRLMPGKHRYLMPLDAEMRVRILPLAKPYPKRAGSIAANAPAIPAGEGGAAPTSALQDS